MKTVQLALVALLGFGTVVAQAQRSGTGVGVILGEPTGISFKQWLAPSRAVDAAAAWSFSDHDSLQLHADYLFHRFDALEPDLQGRAALYYGLGGRLRFNEEHGGRYSDDEETTFGIRFPIGLDIFPSASRIDIFAEIIPVLEVAPSTDFDLDVALGARFFFR